MGRLTDCPLVAFVPAERSDASHEIGKLGARVTASGCAVFPRALVGAVVGCARPGVAARRLTVFARIVRAILDFRTAIGRKAARAAVIRRIVGPAASFWWRTVEVRDLQYRARASEIGDRILEQPNGAVLELVPARVNLIDTRCDRVDHLVVLLTRVYFPLTAQDADSPFAILARLLFGDISGAQVWR